MSVICLKVSRKNYKLSTLARASASHTDRSNSQASLLDTHRMSRIDMPGNSIFSELIVYLRKIGVSYHWDEQKLQFLHTYFSPEARDIGGFFIKRKASGRTERILMTLFKHEGKSLLFLHLFREEQAS